MTKGFYFDAESCIACHTCQVACKDVHDLPVGVNYRIVRSFCTGGGFTPRSYNVSVSVQGCDLCSELRALGEELACVTSCPMRALEFGEMDELRARHAGETLVDGCPAVPHDTLANPNFIMRIKDCMMDEDFDEYII
jgi:anaerobic dimethyl sulfoxide reductase subunit B (iron-sulfur subunit)